jgi:hypothetical protein
MKTWGVGLWALLVALILLVVGLVWRIFTDYKEVGILKYYLIYVSVCAVTFYFTNKRKTA